MEALGSGLAAMRSLTSSPIIKQMVGVTVVFSILKTFCPNFSLLGTIKSLVALAFNLLKLTLKAPFSLSGKVWSLLTPTLVSHVGLGIIVVGVCITVAIVLASGLSSDPPPLPARRHPPEEPPQPQPPPS